MLELGLDIVMSWAPGYLLAKMAFLAWCMAPIQENGSNVIFNQVVQMIMGKGWRRELKLHCIDSCTITIAVWQTLMKLLF